MSYKKMIICEKHYRTEKPRTYPDTSCH